jgi:acyl-coenzyme A synthetase/AMP-(fatty) acid ligase
LAISSSFTKMPPDNALSIRGSIRDASSPTGRFLWSATKSVCFDDLLRVTNFNGRLLELSGRSVLLATRDQLASALALVELDGVANRVIICPPDLPSEHLATVIAKGEVNAIVSDRDLNGDDHLDISLRFACSFSQAPEAGEEEVEHRSTEWVLLTSGTTGAPKMLIHTLRSLTGAIDSSLSQEADVVWGTFYDIRRFGGLQIFLRAALGRGSFVLSGVDEPLGDYVLRLSAHGATHISGTPSHWRRVLMSPQAHALTPRYIRLSGEIADQAILNTLRSFYPQAAVSHAFASTEAGVAFAVNDGIEGFPASMVGIPSEVELKIENGSLRIRSARTSLGYVGGENGALADDEGFVDTGDIVERRGDRYCFLGRRNGVVNVGGLKVYPEEVEAVINRHPAVRMSVVWSRKNSITGSLVAADVVLKEVPDRSGANSRLADWKREIVQICRESLAAHKVPATIRCVPALELASAGKLARRHA